MNIDENQLAFELYKTKGFVDVKQGFIDQLGAFMTREEAWIVAEAAGQIIYPGNCGKGVLYSENLY